MDVPRAVREHLGRAHPDHELRSAAERVLHEQTSVEKTVETKPGVWHLLRASAYRRKGAGAATLYLHGAGLTRMWLPLYERLSESVDLIAPDEAGSRVGPVADALRATLQGRHSGPGHGAGVDQGIGVEGQPEIYPAHTYVSA